MAEEQWIEAGGIPMRYLEVGGGTPVVLIHGIPTSPELWRRVMPHLDRAHFFAWEMVGYGQSWQAGAGQDISVRAQARHLLNFLDAMGIERAVLVGHDLGGGVAQIAAVRTPKRVAGLVLSNAVSYDSWPIARVKLMRSLRVLTARTPRPIFKRQLALSVRPGHEDAGRARESFDAHWPGYSHRGGAATLIRQMRSMRTRDTLDIADRVPRIRTPAVVLWGISDPWQKLEYGERLANELKAPLDAVDGGRHFLPEDRPRRVAAAIEWIRCEVDPG